VPFLDSVVAELALALETKQKVRGFSKKRLLRRAAAPLLPKEIIRGRKQGFSIPVAAWLRGDLAPFARDVLSPQTVERQGYLDPATVSRVLDAHVSGKEDLSRQIWGLLNFTLWFDRYAREPATADPALREAG
jgi:asparagine synthase (glutamine-hydrolysing)